MFDLGSYEFMLMALVALIVIGPKDLPNVLRFVGRWASKARGVVAQFRTGFDDMVRDTELKDMEKKWKEENARIMAEFPDDPMASVGKPKASSPAQIADEVKASKPKASKPKASKPKASKPKASKPKAAVKAKAAVKPKSAKTGKDRKGVAS